MDDSIIGVWSTEVFNETDQSSGDILTFNQDGTGRHDFHSFAHHSHFDSTTFRWITPKPRHLTIIGMQFFRFGYAEPVHDVRDSHQTFHEVPYEINIETSIRGHTMPVFRADLWTSRDVGFGRETREVSTFSLQKVLSALFEQYANSAKGKLVNAHKLAQDGNWKEFSEQYSADIYALVRKTGLNNTEAQRVVEKLIALMAENIDLFDPARGRFESWLMTLTRWCINDELSKR